MYELKKKIGKVFTSKFVGTWPSSYEKRIYRAAVSQSLRNTAVKISQNVGTLSSVDTVPYPQHCSDCFFVYLQPMSKLEMLKR